MLLGDDLLEQSSMNQSRISYTHRPNSRSSYDRDGQERGQRDMGQRERGQRERETQPVRSKGPTKRNETVDTNATVRVIFDGEDDNTYSGPVAPKIIKPFKAIPAQQTFPKKSQSLKQAPPPVSNDVPYYDDYSQGYDRYNPNNQRSGDNPNNQRYDSRNQRLGDNPNNHRYDQRQGERYNNGYRNREQNIRAQNVRARHNQSYEENDDVVFSSDYVGTVDLEVINPNNYFYY
jgi:hypothetical protein